MNRNKPLTKKQIEWLFHVDIKRGILRWENPSKFSQYLYGKDAGCVVLGNSGCPYWYVKINGVSYRRAQLILFMATGVWPKNQVDHKNHDGTDDRACNLRHATSSENKWNSRPMKRIVDLPRGVYAEGGKFRARIKKFNVSHSLGIFQTKKQASIAYLNARKEMFGKFA